MPSKANRLVLFADILGFGSVARKSDELHDLSFDVMQLVRPDIMRVPVPVRRSRKAWFLGFHAAVSQISLRDRQALGNHSIVAFSDSVFIAGDATGIVRSATGLMRLCLLQRIPVRMGIGKGTWTELHFGSSYSSTRRHHAAQFFGSGVTNAYHAEHYGGKGLRIFVHPSAVKRLRREERLLILPKDSRNEHASHELNYVKRRGGGYRNQLRSYHRLSASLVEMEARAEKEKFQYEATGTALLRMRAQLVARSGET